MQGTRTPRGRASQPRPSQPRAPRLWRSNSVPTTIDDYLRLRIADVRRLGLFPDEGDTRVGVLSWERNGRKTAQITVGVRYPKGGEPLAVFAYTYDGEPRQCSIDLVFSPSNLPSRKGTGYYYFVCPRTGQRCRNLYFVNGYFVSRRAFKPLYWSQTLSQKLRATESLNDLLMFREIARQELEPSRYRRVTYKGKLTPYGRKVLRVKARLESLGARCQKSDK